MAKRRRSSPHVSTPSSQFRPDPDSDSGMYPIYRTPFSTGAIIPARTLKSISLHDWWLSRAQGNGLRVEGLETKGRSGVRSFSSGAISKRHDSNTLETVDGITVTINGLMNRSRSQGNGFSIEVCNRFLLGFPYDWEDYAARSYGEEESVGRHESKLYSAEFENDKDGSLKTFFPASLDDIPVSRIRDFLMSPLEVPGDCFKRKILDDIGKITRSRVAESSSPDPTKLETKDRIPTIIVKSVGEETLSDHRNSLVPRMGVKTRSMTRQDAPPPEASSVRKHNHSSESRENVKEKRGKNVSSKSISTDDGCNSGRVRTTRSASKRKADR